MSLLRITIPVGFSVDPMPTPRAEQSDRFSFMELLLIADIANNVEKMKTNVAKSEEC